MSTKDGGYAYPSRGNRHTDKYGDVHEGPGTSGMTLRDYFAGQALAGLNVGNTKDDTCTPDDVIADIAYRIADAMLKAREKERTE